MEMPERNPLCPDASALINLLGSGVPSEILGCLDSRILVARPTFSEVKKSPYEGTEEKKPLIPLIEGGFLEVVELSPAELDIFMELVSAPTPDDLDDGEAATLACAVTRGAAVVIDERKGRRICASKFPGLEIRYSIDLFIAYCGRYGLDLARKALKAAIKYSRMRIPASHKQWVDDVLG
jgi:predicted nucleic acid-binding protein